MIIAGARIDEKVSCPTDLKGVKNVKAVKMGSNLGFALRLRLLRQACFGCRSVRRSTSQGAKLSQRNCPNEIVMYLPMKPLGVGFLLLVFLLIYNLYEVKNPPDDEESSSGTL